MYKPRYCRECGQRIERERWRSWHSTGLCNRCAPRFHLNWLGRTSALIILGVVIGFVLGSWDAARQYAPAAVLEIEPQAAVFLPGLGSRQGQEKESPSAQSRSENTSPPNDLKSSPDQSPAKAVSRSKSKAAEVGICGAPTKSGKPCRRRVRGGGRCWQHRDK
ncbi:MAG: hypothetical protein HY314_02935 [Acidobacteria bacterium]|nr:hypothetical protein [Acidobacteriota bacterium]